MEKKLFNLYIKPLRFRIEDDYIEKTGRPISVLSYERAKLLMNIPGVLPYPVTAYQLHDDDTHYVVYKNTFWLYYYFYCKSHKHIVRKSEYPELFI